MKSFLTLAAVAAAFATSSLAQANDRAGGHWEWQSRPTPGPNKSNVTSQVRIWIEGGTSAMVDHNCAMHL